MSYQKSVLLEKLIVEYKGYPLSTLKSPDGTFWVETSYVDNVLGFYNKWTKDTIVSRLPSRQKDLGILIDNGLKGNFIKGIIDGQARESFGISLEDFGIVLQYAASRNQRKALQLIVCQEQPPKPSEIIEPIIQVKEELGLNGGTLEASVVKKLLATLQNAKTEVCCPVGRIDVLTDWEIIEVKKISEWKSAIGQVLVYSLYYPHHSKRIHLFDSPTKTDYPVRQLIVKTAHQLNVSVTFD